MLKLTLWNNRTLSTERVLVSSQMDWVKPGCVGVGVSGHGSVVCVNGAQIHVNETVEQIAYAIEQATKAEVGGDE